MKMPKKGKKYTHLKTGGEYLVMGMALHTETNKEMVIYSAINGDRIFVRPLEGPAGWNTPTGDGKKRFVHIIKTSVGGKKL